MFTQLAPMFSISPQLTELDVDLAAAAGIKTIICNRPDGEPPGHQHADRLAVATARHDVAFVYIPVIAGSITDADVAKMDVALKTMAGPVLAYCRSGARAAMLWALTQSGSIDPDIMIRMAADAGVDITSIAPRLRRLSHR